MAPLAILTVLVALASVALLVTGGVLTRRARRAGGLSGVGILLSLFGIVGVIALLGLGLTVVMLLIEDLSSLP